MNRQLPLALALLTAVGLNIEAPANPPANGGHGGGAGHAFRYPGGWCGGWRGGYRCYRYPGWCGVGFGWYGYGYPYCPYGYPVYVDPLCGPPPVVVGPTPAVVAAAATAPGSPGNVTPVSLTAADVMLSVHVPPEATVWVNAEKTTQSGPYREFVSSGLEPGRTYTFDLRAPVDGAGRHRSGD
jgi:uncharacterized protein (TIGR03000 family)